MVFGNFLETKKDNIVNMKIRYIDNFINENSFYILENFGIYTDNSRFILDTYRDFLIEDEVYDVDYITGSNEFSFNFNKFHYIKEFLEKNILTGISVKYDDSVAFYAMIDMENHHKKFIEKIKQSENQSEFNLPLSI